VLFVLEKTAVYKGNPRIWKHPNGRWYLKIGDKRVALQTNHKDVAEKKLAEYLLDNENLRIYDPKDVNEVTKKRLLLRELKRTLPCAGCGNVFSDCIEILDFHHMHDKEFVIAKMASEQHSFDELKRELTKCVLLCANCHRRLHAGRISHAKINNAISHMYDFEHSSVGVKPPQCIADNEAYLWRHSENEIWYIMYRDASGKRRRKSTGTKDKGEATIIFERTVSHHDNVTPESALVDAAISPAEHIVN
jgi:hypothetical protein